MTTTTTDRLLVALSLALASCATTPTDTKSLDLEGAEHAGAGVAVGEAPAIEPDDWDGLEAALQGEGLVGWMHASVPEAGLFVFTYRKPGDFFAYVDLPLAPTKESYAALAELSRHDEVRLYGSFVGNGASKPHVRVSKVELVEAYASAYETPAYARELSLPEGLLEETEIVAKVHAVGGEGSVLVLEWQDAVVPVRVSRPELVNDLWRNDKVRVAVAPAPYPGKPAHWLLDTEAAQPLELLERVAEHHGEPTTLRGRLVLFPKSPQIIFDIYALQVEDADGIRRNYTLVNFEDMDAFEAIRGRLGEIWAASPEAAVNGRNKLVKPGLELEVQGILNVVSPAQANPQLLLDSPDSIRVLGDAP
ncbi:hypothetical protein PPSIR1_01597 [Plesiocystis pacifica SIR-1]|uniref:Uncharacterized protein n=1 Tax=Plesiocystis pacifica SIR-1 TaxID=391625 RepID=A6G8H0_9BACT|nr:hypothetical protein [Plesiocystis pacifica]EDM77880.1 hypothetical protein PPSIR1_01597 [Plesiocystis pacifica SIR-1]